jgi:hypothetical protein
VGERHEFFLAQAGAAGVLVGLVFVGVSINLEKILSDPGSGLTGRAAEALILLVAVLTASTLLLVELLRHASVAITLDTYSHMLPGMGSEAAAAIGAALG